jgi:hypothetical protein
MTDVRQQCEALEDVRDRLNAARRVLLPLLLTYNEPGDDDGESSLMLDLTITLLGHVNAGAGRGFRLRRMFEIRSTLGAWVTGFWQYLWRRWGG